MKDIEFTIKRLLSIQDWQNAGFVHEMTCGKDPNHGKLKTDIQNDKIIMVCPTCDYIQKHIPDCVLNFDCEQYKKSLSDIGIKV